MRIKSLKNLFFLNAMYGILEEMKSSSDFQEEREMVRDKLREMFSVYQ